MTNIHQSLKHAPLAAAIVSALGFSVAVPMASAATLANGDYTIFINPTPFVNGAYDFGSNGIWNSGFTFGCVPGTKGCASQSMSDTGASLSGPGFAGNEGSGVGGDGWAGRVGIHVSNNGSITVTSFSKDVIFSTAGGTFAQYFPGQSVGKLGGAGVTITGSGSVDASGNMTLGWGDNNTPAIGRLGAISSFPALTGSRWNFDDECAVNGYGWTGSIFTTGTAYLATLAGGCTDRTPTMGKPLTCTSDVNGDGINDCDAILVNGGTVGTDWGGFKGGVNSERWNVKILSAVIKTPTISTNPGTAQTISVPPSGSTGISTDYATAPCNGTMSGLCKMTLVSATNGTNGTVTVNIGAGTVTYTPNPGFTGPSDSFTYIVKDGNSENKTGTVNVNVVAVGFPAPVNDGPVAVNQNGSASINAGSNDNITNTPATYTIVSAPTHGTAVVTNATTGVITYTATDSAYVGNDSFTYRATDSLTQFANATVSVTLGAWGLPNNGTYAPSTTAALIGAKNGRIAAANIATVDSTVKSKCVIGCFDFKVTGVASSVIVSLPPLDRAITASDITDNLRYRILIGSTWKAFDTSSGDAVASAPLVTGASGGGCPLPGAGSWQTWTNAVASSANVGDQCIRLSITDNGPNDSDSTVGTIADPSGPGSGTPTADATTPDSLNSFGSSSQGCSISPITRKSTEGGEWWLVAGFLVWLRALLWRRNKASDINQV